MVNAAFPKDNLCIDHILNRLKKVPNTPLRPHILAAFLPWGGFAGAGRPARRKVTPFPEY